VRIDEAVAMHMVSDVPVGAFLSGGLDSSVVVAKMAKRSSVPISTFCVGSDVPAYDERGHARTMAAHSGTAHHEVAVSSDLLHRIPRLVRCMDEPSDPIAACIDEVARLASRHVKVVLGGDGGDEMFAGFDRYAAFPWVARYAALPAWLCTGVFGRAAGALPESFAYKSLSQKARWLASVSVERGGRLYARMTSHFRFGPEDKQWLYGPWLRAALGSRDTLAAVAEPFERTPAHDDLDRMIGADLLTRLPEHTLMLADRLGMAHGLEVRAPLLDVPLAELCLAMPARLRIRGTVTKYALRRAAQPWLPTSLLRRAKQGFMFPVAYWLAGERLRDVAATLRAGPLLREGWVEAPAIDRLIEEHAARRADHHVRIWMLMSLDAWHRIYLGGEQAGEA
jgi:asparagine synthase (glutamine-hydrolysing)